MEQLQPAPLLTVPPVPCVPPTKHKVEEQALKAGLSEKALTRLSVSTIPVEQPVQPRNCTPHPGWHLKPALTPDRNKPPMVEDHDQPQHFIQTAVTASPEWLAARNAFYNHLMPCRDCHAPVGRYCPAGAELRQRYDATEIEPTLLKPETKERAQ
ncbi:hypothetical protein [Pseudomonas guineae]|nr:hypothetical protein [Pseudomonas guineae]